MSHDVLLHCTLLCSGVSVIVADAVTAADMQNVRTDHGHETHEKKTGRQIAFTNSVKL